jgi:hypothetical protein
MRFARAAGAVLAPLLLVAFQVGVMERAPETRDEMHYSTFRPDVSMGRAVLTYVSLLFTGSFRVLAVDYLWMEYAKAGDRHQYDVAHEYASLLQALQSRNPEVWVALSHDYTHNLPAVSPEEERWPLIKQGYRTLATANAQIPNSPTLTFEMAYKLIQKVYWQRPDLDLALIRRIEEDPELQVELSLEPPPPPGAPGRSPFELAIPWLRRTIELVRREVQRHGATSYYTQMGVLVDPSSQEGWIWAALYNQAHLEWVRNRHDQAVAVLERTAEQNERIVQEYGDEISPIYQRRLPMLRAMIPLVRLHQRARESRDPSLLRPFLERAESLLLEYERLDDGFIQRHVRDTRVVLASRELTRRGLGQNLLILEAPEPDDFPELATALEPKTYTGWIFPADTDQDVYWLGADAGNPEAVPPPRALRLTLRSFRLPNQPAPPRLHVRLLSGLGERAVVLDDAIVEPDQTYLFDRSVERTRHTMVFISALDAQGEPAPYELTVDRLDE